MQLCGEIHENRAFLASPEQDSEGADLYYILMSSKVTKGSVLNKPFACPPC